MMSAHKYNIMCLGDVHVLKGKYMTWLLLVSSDYSILIFSAQFGEERPSLSFGAFCLNSSSVIIVTFTRAHCMHSSGIDKCCLYALTCSGNAPCWCNFFVMYGRDQFHLNTLL